MMVREREEWSPPARVRGVATGESERGAELALRVWCLVWDWESQLLCENKMRNTQRVFL
jgi:hypothetical protein